MSLLGPVPDTKKDAEFILGLVGKTYAHQLSPFFRGTITAVAAQPAGQVGYLVRIQRSENTVPDGVDYLCVLPGYVPAIGDVVDLMWRDARTGYVFAVLQSSGSHIRSTGPVATLGALQSGITSQSIVGTDTAGRVTVTAGGSGLTAPSAVALVSFRSAYASTPVIVLTAGYPGGGVQIVYEVSAAGVSGFTIVNAIGALAASTTYAINYLVIGLS